MLKTAEDIIKEDQKGKKKDSDQDPEEVIQRHFETINDL